MAKGPFDAVLFDLLSALLDSWSLWNHVAGSPQKGLAWRRKYLDLTYEADEYRDYELIVGEAAHATGLAPEMAQKLIQNFGEVEPWPEARNILKAIAARVPIGVVTNCSRRLGQLAIQAVAVPFTIIITAEEAGVYKPRPEPYLKALDALSTEPARTLFVAGSPYDVPGAANVGMPVYWHNRQKLTPLGPIGSGGPIGPGGPGGNDAQAIVEAQSLTPLLEIV